MNRTLSLSLFTAFVCLFFQFQVRAQAVEGPLKLNIIPPSPNSAALAKYVDFPTIPSSGVAPISLPLGSIAGKALSIPIALNYHAGGARVEEVASWVGQGWTLSGGGVITKTVRGLPDDVNTGMLIGFNYMAKKISDHVNHVYSHEEDKAFMKYCAEGMYDTEPDQYFFNFQGKSGKIIFDADGNGTVAPYQKLLIVKTSDGFSITDESGVKYSFEAPEYTENMDACGSNIPEFISSWYLTSITTPTGEVASFGYESGVTFQNITPQESIYIAIACPNTMNGLNCLKIYKIRTCRLSSINIGKSSINFLGNTARIDLPDSSSEMRLDEIEFKYDNTVVRRILLDYGVLGCNRLRLNKVKETNGASTTSSNLLYAFDYLYPEEFPCTNSKAQDHWGFYNNNNTGSLLPPGKMYPTNSTVTFFPGADRSPDFSRTQSGILNKITYPTGGYSKFEYELNNYGFINQRAVAEWEQTTVDIGVTATPSKQTDEQGFTIDYDQDIAIDYQINITENVGENPTVLEYVAVINTADNSTVKIISSGKGSLGIFLAAGSYKLVAYSENPITRTGAFLSCKVRTNIPITSKSTGGLRIAKITAHDGIGGAPDMITTYKYKMSNEPSRSSGVIALEPNYQYYFKDNTARGCSYFVRTSVSTALGSSPGGHIGYREVLVEKSNGSSSMSKYNTFYDYPDVLGVSALKPSVVQYDFMRGLLLKQIDYKTIDRVKVPVKEISNHYVIDINNNKKIIKGFKITYEVKGSLSTPDTFYEDTYDFLSEWFYQDSSKVVTFDTKGLHPIVTTKAIKYANPNHTQPTSIETFKSNGVKETNVITYPLDYASGTTFIDNMNAAHIVNYPIEKVNYLTNSSNEIKIINGGIIKYDNGGKGLKDEDLVLENSTPLDLAAFKFSNKLSLGKLPTSGSVSAFSTDPSYKSKLKVNQYDNRSNILEYQATDGVKVSVIWDYDQLMPVTQVINASQNEIAYTSFEAESKGNWSFSGRPFLSDLASTGGFVYQLSSGSMSKDGLISDRIYTLTYRTRNAIPFVITGTIGNAIVTRSSGGWTSYQHQLTGISSVQLSGTGIIDEVRLYPSDASMTSYTYTPMIGMSSQTDAKGQTTYYDYDEFQRLKNVKDQNGNIIKNNTYHYKP